MVPYAYCAGLQETITIALFLIVAELIAFSVVVEEAV